MRIGLGVGFIATVLIPIALLLFRIFGPVQTISAILLLSGLWAFVFGVFMERKAERLYYAGSGAIVALLSTFLFLPFSYTAGLVLVAMVVLALIWGASKPGARPLQR